jgi:hypothetical protein
LNQRRRERERYAQEKERKKRASHEKGRTELLEPVAKLRPDAWM